MIKNKYLLLIIILFVGFVTTLTSQYIYITVLMLTDIYFSLFYLLLAYCIAKSINLVLSLNIKDNESEELSVKLKPFSVIIAVLLVVFSVIHIDGIYGGYAYKDDTWDLLPLNERYVATSASYLYLAMLNDFTYHGVSGNDYVFEFFRPFKNGWIWWYSSTSIGFSLYVSWFWLLLTAFFTYRFSFDEKLDFNIRDFVEDAVDIRSED